MPGCQVSWMAGPSAVYRQYRPESREWHLRALWRLMSVIQDALIRCGRGAVNSIWPVGAGGLATAQVPGTKLSALQSDDHGHRACGGRLDGYDRRAAKAVPAGAARGAG